MYHALSLCGVEKYSIRSNVEFLKVFPYAFPNIIDSLSLITSRETLFKNSKIESNDSENDVIYAVVHSKCYADLANLRFLVVMVFYKLLPEPQMDQYLSNGNGTRKDMP